MKLIGQRSSSRFWIDSVEYCRLTARILEMLNTLQRPAGGNDMEASS